MEIDVYQEISAMLKRAYDKGYKAGLRDSKKKYDKTQCKHYCRECKWWCGDKSSIGVRCMNTTRKRTGRHDTSAYKYPSAPACKSGFEPRTADK